MPIAQCNVAYFKEFTIIESLRSRPMINLAKTTSSVSPSVVGLNDSSILTSLLSSVLDRDNFN